MKTKIIFLFLLAAATARAQITNYWIVGSGNYTNPENWSLTAIPGKTDTAAFTNPATYTVTFTADVDPDFAFEDGLVLFVDGNGSGQEIFGGNV